MLPKLGAYISHYGLRRTSLRALNLISVFASGFIIYKGLSLITNTESPVVVVQSGSMEPACYRGDILLLWNPRDTPYRVGDITVFRLPRLKTPVVHRIIEAHNDPADPLEQKLLTKGDNNSQDDLAIYEDIDWLERKYVIGKVWGYIPYIGYASIALSDFPQIKYALFGGLALFTILQGP